MKLRNRWILAAASAILVLLGVRWVQWVRRPLSSRVGDACEAMVRGDARALFAYASAREIREEGLTPTKLQAVLDRLILPQIAREVGAPDTEDDTGDFHAVYWRKVVTRDGRRSSVGFELWSGEHGLETNVLGRVLEASWKLRSMPTGGYVRPADYFEGGVRGIQEDAPFLTSLGLRGTSPSTPDKPFHTWDQLEARARNLVAQHASDAPFRRSG